MNSSRINPGAFCSGVGVGRVHGGHNVVVDAVDGVVGSCCCWQLLAVVAQIYHLLD